TLLHPLFIHLRRADIPLGIDDYRLALEVLRSGMGLEDPQRLKSTCRLLWAKSRADQIIFDQAYALLVEPQLKMRPITLPPPPPPPPSNRRRNRWDLDTRTGRDESYRQSTPEAQASVPQAAALPVTP